MLYIILLFNAFKVIPIPLFEVMSIAINHLYLYKICLKFAKHTGGDTSFFPWKLHFIIIKGGLINGHINNALFI